MTHFLPLKSNKYKPNPHLYSSIWTRSAHDTTFDTIHGSIATYFTVYFHAENKVPNKFMPKTDSFLCWSTFQLLDTWHWVQAGCQPPSYSISCLFTWDSNQISRRTLSSTQYQQSPVAPLMPQCDDEWRCRHIVIHKWRRLDWTIYARLVYDESKLVWLTDSVRFTWGVFQ